jgi:hypothetical protein
MTRLFLQIISALLLPISIPAATILVTGNTDPAASGTQLQAAIDSAQPGDTILISPNEFRGPIVLRKKVNPSGLAITLQSAAPTQNLPAPGVRTGPSYSSYLPQITAQGGLAAMTTEPGSNYYNLVNLEFRPHDPGALFYSLLYLGFNDAGQSTFDAVPQFVNVDRCYIHGYPNVNQKLGIQLSSGNTKITNSYLAEFHSDIQDASAISGINGPGPYQIINNYIEAAAVNILFGGAVPFITGQVPSNILVAKNDFVKLLSYKNWDKVDSATYAAIVQADPNRAAVFLGNKIPNYVIHTLGAYTPNVKNMFELKYGQDVTVIANTFTNTYVQADQFGVPLALTPRTEQGAVPWATVQRVSISNNIFRHQSGVVVIGAADVGQTGPRTNNITFYNNLFDDIRPDYAYDYERIFESRAITNLRMDHNTILGIGEYLSLIDTTPLNNFTYTDNIVSYGGGFSAQCGGYNASAYACGFNGFNLNKNIFIGVPTTAVLPAFTVPNQFFPADVNSVGFVDALNLGADYHNYALAPTSPYKAKGIHQSDPGFMPAAYDYARSLY